MSASGRQISSPVGELQQTHPALAHLAWVDFEIKVKQIAHSTLRFDQWNPLISKK